MVPSRQAEEKLMTDFSRGLAAPGGAGGTRGVVSAEGGAARLHSAPPSQFAPACQVPPASRPVR